MCHPSSLQIFVPVKVAYLYQSWIGFVSKKGKKKQTHTQRHKKREQNKTKKLPTKPQKHTQKKKRAFRQSKSIKK